MDLRTHNISPAQAAAAIDILNYQPFIISDQVQTGVAYSWLHGKEGGRLARAQDFVLDKRSADPRSWAEFIDANARLRTMYDDWVKAIAEVCPGGSLLDCACNNGYFLIRALQAGMSKATGYDRADYSASVAFLNKVTGQRAKFVHRAYSPWTHRIDGCQPHDVVVASLILCHISDPLYFLAFLGKMARQAIFYFGGMSKEPGYRIYYSKPNKFYPADEFPVCFDNDVGLSEELFFDGLSMMGFETIRVLPYNESWLPTSWYGNQKAILAMR